MTYLKFKTESHHSVLKIFHCLLSYLEQRIRPLIIVLYGQEGLSKWDPGQAASATPGKLLEMQVLRPNSPSVGTETWGWGAAVCSNKAAL